jgi:hypothetical protein
VDVCRCERGEHFADSSRFLFSLVLGWRQGDLTPFLRTKEQQHRWNCPFQLGHDTGDEPEAAILGEKSVKVGDIIVLATDGYFDNVFDERTVQVIEQFVEREAQRQLFQSGWPGAQEAAAATGAAAAPTAASASTGIPSVDSIASSLSSSTLSPSSPASSSPASSSSSSSIPHIPVAEAVGSTPLTPRSPRSSSSSNGSSDPVLLDADALKRLAQHLVSEANLHARNRFERTPFSENAARHGKKYKGGKMDDVTVVCAQVHAV